MWKDFFSFSRIENARDFLTGCEFVRRRMDGNVPISAAGRNRNCVDGFVLAGGREFPMLVYLAMVNEGEATHEGRRYRE